MEPGADPQVSAAQGQREPDAARTGVLLCHGFTGSTVSMQPWADALAAAGHEVSVPLLAGHGTRWQDLARTTWGDWYASLAVAYAELSTRCDRVVMGALSMGGALALRFAAMHPGAVAGLMLVNPAIASRDRRIPLTPLLKHLVPTTAAIANDTAKPGTSEGAYDRTPTAAVAELNALWRDVRGRLGDVRAPILLLRSTVDHVVDDSSERALMGGVGSSSVRRVSLPNSFHVATLDHDADLIVAESLQFLASLPREEA